MKRRFKGRRAPRGMTLIEIMVVLVILGLIASAVVIAVFPQLQKARVDRTTLDIGNIDSGLKLYNARKGKFPDTATRQSWWCGTLGSSTFRTSYAPGPGLYC